MQRPLDLGADLVIHSTTKYLGGHCDVTGGVVIAKTKTDFFDRVREIQTTGGAVPSPFDCWLILRGMRSLPWRMRAHSENAQQGRDLARRSSARGSGALSGTRLACRPRNRGAADERVQRDAFVRGARRPRGGARRGGEDGDFYSRDEPGRSGKFDRARASIKGEDPRTPQGLLRLSIGLEHPDDLIEDLAQALE